MTTHCPNEKKCQHSIKLKLDQRGRCSDCGTQVTGIGSSGQSSVRHTPNYSIANGTAIGYNGRPE
jgi:hypothetical protein